ncbi:lysophospholipid acyltransferase family protein [Methylacidimicrobium sp. B4]|uniref:lysophospholipid acyltransferase family protein n=1 Tax=Methylacidimicrobium sp. B4 TaxID=2796139 RepID=UPI001A8E5487|nr:lysophospholipid acyltransferase family protein [Methylacidimicrobium sp. B4]QSR84279.1 lysophospholipid acyltransferase family protein [Methylacidimicrobium sp. B4]
MSSDRESNRTRSAPPGRQDLGAWFTARRRSLRRNLSPVLGALLIRRLTGTLRPTIEDPQGIVSRPPREPLIFAFWHNRLLVMPALYSRHLPGRKLVALVSASNDGEVLARLLAQFGFEAARGSSSRRGSLGFRTILRLGREGRDIAVTPDGPRGPRYQLQDGVLQVAQLLQRPVLPITCRFSRKWELRSWDRFQIPYPFSRCTIHVGSLITPPRDDSPSELAACRDALEEALRPDTQS